MEARRTSFGSLVGLGQLNRSLQNLPFAKMVAEDNGEKEEADMYRKNGAHSDQAVYTFERWNKHRQPVRCVACGAGPGGAAAWLGGCCRRTSHQRDSSMLLGVRAVALPLSRPCSPCCRLPLLAAGTRATWCTCSTRACSARCCRRWPR